MSTENKYQFKGTQGEWQVGKTPALKDKVVDANGFSIATLGYQSKSDAHLIAAAPDLLFAAIQVIQSRNPLQLHDSIDVLNEAVNKALNITE